MLKKIFIELCSKHTNNMLLAEDLWTEIETAYSYEKRFYHNLDHLQHLIASLKEVKDQFNQKKKGLQGSAF